MTPRKLNKEFIDNLTDLLTEGYSLPDASRMLDVTSESVRLWRRYGRKTGTGICYDLHKALTAIDQQKEMEKMNRRQLILQRRIDKLKQQYSQEYGQEAA